MLKYLFYTIFFVAMKTFSSSYKIVDDITSYEMQLKFLKTYLYDTIIQPYADTTAHINEFFVKKKSKYINKPLNKLSNALDIRPMSYTVGTPDNNMYVSNAISLSFLNKDQT